GFLDEYISKERLHKMIRYVDDIYLRFGAPEHVYGDDEEKVAAIAKKAVMADLRLIPSRIRHLGSGRTLAVLQAMQEELERKGVEVAFDSACTELLVEQGVAVGVRLKNGQEYRAKYIIVGPGREGSEWLVGEGRRLGLPPTVNPV